MTACGNPDSARPGGASKFGDQLDPEADTAWRGANREALDLGHTWVGTEHLLLGLLHGPADDPATGILGAHGLTLDLVRDALVRDLGGPPPLDSRAMLATLGVDLDAIRASVEATFGPDAIDALYARRRRDGHRLAYGPLCGLALAPRAKQALVHARRAAKSSHRSLVTTSDLLAGLLAIDDGMAVQLLRALDVDPAGLRDQLRPRAAS